tara:strand:+ start:139 stop:345 length:207 start_codon:yes stop_codon:yes gene_type:complete
MKYKKDQKILVDRKSKKVRTIRTFMRSVLSEVLQKDLENDNTPPKMRQKIRNELVRRNKIFKEVKNNS